MFLKFLLLTVAGQTVYLKDYHTCYTVVAEVKGGHDSLKSKFFVKSTSTRYNRPNRFMNLDVDYIEKVT